MSDLKLGLWDMDSSTPPSADSYLVWSQRDGERLILQTNGAVTLTKGQVVTLIKMLAEQLVEP